MEHTVEQIDCRCVACVFVCNEYENMLFTICVIPQPPNETQAHT